MRSRLHAILSVAALLLAGTLVHPRAEAADVETLRERAQAVADRVTSLERRLSTLTERKEELAAEIGSSSAAIGVLELKLHETEQALGHAREKVEERAVEMYMSSSSGDELEMLLAAEDLAELALITEVQAAAAHVEEEFVDDLEAVAVAAESDQDELEDKKSALLAAQAEVAAVEEEIAGSLDERKQALADLSAEIEVLQAEARRAAREAAEAAAREAAREAVTPTIPSNLPAPTGDLADRLVGTGPTSGVPDLFTTTGVTFEGEASWYGPGFEGNLTANGDVYDSSLYTAASKTLPLNTYLYIEYEGRGCVVLVNDRGPYVGNRILDLSRGTAAAIGMEHAGVGWVTAEILIRP